MRSLKISMALVGVCLASGCTTPGPGSEGGGSESESSESSGTEDESGETETGNEDDEPGCIPEHFVGAPPPTEVDGLLAVPIDIHELSAALDFDLEEKRTLSRATIRFTVGATGGMPMFDLRQKVGVLVLDDVEIDAGLLERHDFGYGLEDGFVVLPIELEPCTTHTLGFGYWMGTPDAPGGQAPYFYPDINGVSFSFYMRDTGAVGRFLESSFPANLPFDTHAMTLEVNLTPAVEHSVITNAEVEVVGDNQWLLEFPEDTRAWDPMLLIRPTSGVTMLEGVHPAANGQEIPYQIWRSNMLTTPAEEYRDRTLAALDEFVISSGEYRHPSLVVWIHFSGEPFVGGMEYRGGFTSKEEAIEHEMFHSFWARKLDPASYAEGWLDEAWAEYNIDSGFGSMPLTYTNPVQLLDPNPFARDTPESAYDEGETFFVGLADILGVDQLRALMKSYRELDPLHGRFDTPSIERHLYCEGGELPELRKAFAFYVYGQADDPPPPPADYCE